MNTLLKIIYTTFVFVLLCFFSVGCTDTGTVLFASDDSEGTSGKNLYASDDSEDNSGKNLYASGDGEGTSDTAVSINNDAGNTADNESVSSRVYVFVCGHVNSPGVYELDSDSRICDALELAGGITDDGVPEAIGQAKPVSDGQTIYVPGIDEVQNGWNYNTESLDMGLPGDSPGTENDDRININSASKEELKSLPGIGESKAADIINYREEHGVFESIDELKNIQGIKEGVFNKIKDRIRI